MLSPEQVRYIASLSRIHLQETEINSLTQKLGNILQYIEKLEKLDVTGVNPTSHVLPLKNVYREDKVLPSLPQAEVMRFAVNHHNGSFKVPQVIE